MMNIWRMPEFTQSTAEIDDAERRQGRGRFTMPVRVVQALPASARHDAPVRRS
jgi:hypothetical protein